MHDEYDSILLSIIDKNSLSKSTKELVRILLNMIRHKELLYEYLHEAEKHSDRVDICNDIEKLDIKILKRKNILVKQIKDDLDRHST